mgnify:FL=1
MNKRRSCSHPILTCIHDIPADKLVYACSCAEKFFGAGVNELCPLTIQEVWSRLYIDQQERNKLVSFSNHCRSLPVGTSHQIVIQTAHRDSDRRCLQIYGSPFGGRGSDGLFSQLLYMIYPLEKGREEEQGKQCVTEEPDEWFHSLFHNQVTMMAVCRAADDRFVEANNPFLEKLEYDPDEIITLTWRDIVAQKTDDEPLPASLACGEQEIKTKSGKILTLHICSALLPYRGELCRIQIGHDITIQKEMEKELRRLDRLNLIGEMAASIGHEVRNPMTTVRGYLQLFQNRPAFANHLHQINVMIDELDRANSIISEFLSLAKNKSLEIKPGNLNSVVTSLFPLIQADAFRMGHDAAAQLGDLPDIRFDTQEIRQLLLNLTRNALEAMTAGGLLTIRTFFDGTTVSLQVIDNGPGIPEQLLEKIAQPFVTTKENGTGLGLPVCYRIMERHNGELQIRSSPQGTTVTVRFKITSHHQQEGIFYQQQELFPPRVNFFQVNNDH